MKLNSSFFVFIFVLGLVFRIKDILTLLAFFPAASFFSCSFIYGEQDSYMCMCACYLFRNFLLVVRLF